MICSHSRITNKRYAVQHNITGRMIGEHNTNCSHFYITLKATPWINTNWLPLGKLCEHVCAYHILSVATITLVTTINVDTIHDHHSTLVNDF